MTFVSAPSEPQSPSPVQFQTAAESINEARILVQDQFTRRPLVYWADLILTLAIGYLMAALYLRAPLWSAQQGIGLVVAGFALFRAGSYVHEITHMRAGEMLGFRIGWNLIAGIPLVMPSHFYENHIDHHNSHHYGTTQDGEYLPLGTGKLRDVLYFFAQVPLLPAYIALRLLFAPLTFVHPKVRNWVLEHMSSYVINFRHRLYVAPNAPRKAWAALELACSLRVAGMLGVVAVGLFPITRLVLMYCLATFVLLLNYIRNLVAHRYQNTGGQMSKSTPRGAVAKFAAGGKPMGKKDLGLIAMSYGNVYVARVAMGAKDEQTLRAFLEAEAYDGPSLIIAYSHCLMHGIDMSKGMRNQKAAVESGQWPLYRYNPERAENGENPMSLDSRAPKIPVKDYLHMETRFNMLEFSKPEVAKTLFAEAQNDVNARWALYEYLSSRSLKPSNGNTKET